MNISRFFEPVRQLMHDFASLMTILPVVFALLGNLGPLNMNGNDEKKVVEPQHVVNFQKNQ